MASPKAPPETKVVVGSAAGIVTALITWVLITTIPAFKHGGIPSQYSVLIPGVATWLVATIAAYRAPHTHRPDLLPGLEETLSVVAKTVVDSLAATAAQKAVQPGKTKPAEIIPPGNTDPGAWPPG
jgi:hypothetical protein